MEIEGFAQLEYYEVKDPLKWWSDNRGSFPCLSRMARDFLTIPSEFFFP